MNKLPGVDEALALLGQLQQAVRDASAQAAQNDAELRSQTQRAQLAFAGEGKTLESQTAIALAELDAAAGKERERLAAGHSTRRIRVSAAYQRALAARTRRIDDAENRKISQIQTALLQAERAQETGRADTKKAAEDFQAALAADYAALLTWVEHARESLRGFCELPESVDIEVAAAPASGSEDELLAQFRATFADIGQRLARFRRLPLPWFFRTVSVSSGAALLALGHAGYAVWLRQQGAAVSYERLGGALAGSLVLLAVLFFLGRKQARPIAANIAAALAQAQQLHDLGAAAAAKNFPQRLEDIDRAFQITSEQLNREWAAVPEEPARERVAVKAVMDRKLARVLAKVETRHTRQLAQSAQSAQATKAQAVAATAAQTQQLAAAKAARLAQLQKDSAARDEAIAAELKNKSLPVFQTIEAASRAAETLFPPWQPEFLRQWAAPAEFTPVVKFARLEVDVETLAGVTLAGARFTLPGPARFTVPLALEFPRRGSVLFETAKAGREESIAALNEIILRLLATAPPGRVSFSLIDPVGLGQSFSGITHLADFGENLIHGRIWTQPAQIEARLAELNEHMEKMIQMFLRNEYETIADYNAKAGSIAEKYHFLVIADFPVNFGETAMKRLMSIAASGARCGVFTLVHWDRRQAAQQEFVADELRRNSVGLARGDAGFALAGKFPAGVKLRLDAPPDAALVTEFINKIGQASAHTNRVEVSFAEITPAEGQIWSLETTEELRVPMGRTGATKLQYLALGLGTRQHALIAGKTGSGKSTLFHVLITNLALWCSPEQVEFYLVDFKKGVEFQCYAAHALPHARVVAIESDREFGLSVLQRVDEELRRRGELFRQAGAQDLAGYNKSGGRTPLPRTLLLVDEFQEFFTEDDRISQSAALLLDRIVRQGRAFGIHVVLGSQTLGGAYTLARATLGQMVVRIALQCNEADAFLIMDDNNPAPRRLTRPGEGIYNDMAGALAGNSPFQTVWLSEAARETQLEKIRALAVKKFSVCPRPIVFEGNAPADVRENVLLNELLSACGTLSLSAPGGRGEGRGEVRGNLGNAAATTPLPALSSPSEGEERVAEGRERSGLATGSWAGNRVPASARLWLGAPNSIKGPTEAVFHRQSGGNLLVVGQRDEAALAILAVGLVSLAAQYPPGAARFIVLDTSAPGLQEKEFIERLARDFPRDLTVVSGAEMEATVHQLAGELQSRTDTANPRPETFLFIPGLQRVKKLRFEEDFGFSGGDGAANPGKELNTLICEGPALGLHVVAFVDTGNNVNRSISRKALTEFEMLVLFKMSANDSAALCDSPRAASLGLHRAVYYNEREGGLEVFRPYALPAAAWLAAAAKQLSAHSSLQPVPPSDEGRG
ncbi:MAG: ATP-binding protein [Verrucomicrobia bacterium]|nr:ATP-binding protein [Verrucomicrobiota bacterium]